jgi:co-chaperonin GroES (HSP10)
MNNIIIQPLNKDILVYDMYFGEQKTSQGIIIIDDDKTDRGIHPRWAKIYAVGPKNNDGLENDNWVLIEHGRWSRGIDLSELDSSMEYGKTVVRRVDPKSILGYSVINPEPKNDGIVGPIMAKG